MPVNKAVNDCNTPSSCTTKRAMCSNKTTSWNEKMKKGTTKGYKPPNQVHISTVMIQSASEKRFFRDEKHLFWQLGSLLKQRNRNLFI